MEVSDVVSADAMPKKWLSHSVGCSVSSGNGLMIGTHEVAGVET